MKKIRLDLDALKVESFVTSKGAGLQEGTVFGMEDTYCEDTCNGVWETCDDGLGCGQSGQCPYTQGQAQSCTGTGPGGTALCTATCPTYDTCEQTCGELPETCYVGPCGPEK